MCRSALILCMFLVSVSPVRALWAPVPLEILVDEADLIVTGKVAKIQNGFVLDGRNYDVAVLEVTKTLKALPAAGKPKQVHIAQPAPGGLAVSTDIQFQAGQEGVWLLRKDSDRDVFWARHPFQFQEAAKQKELTELVAQREKVTGGMVVNGLSARAELVEHQRPKGGSSFEVRFSLQNVGVKPITVCDYAGLKPVQVQWTGPKGEMLKSHHYDWLELARLRGLEKTNFTTIPSGGIRYFGPHGGGTGVYFQPPPPQPRANVIEPGQHRVTIGYASTENGKQFGLENVFTGTVTANEVTIGVKK